MRTPEDGTDGRSRLSNVYGGANNTRTAPSGLVLNFPHPLDFALGPKTGKTGGKHILLVHRRDQIVDQPTTRRSLRPRHVIDSQLLAWYVGRPRCRGEAALRCHFSVSGSRGFVNARSGKAEWSADSNGGICSNYAKSLRCPA